MNFRHILLKTVGGTQKRASPTVFVFSATYSLMLSPEPENESPIISAFQQGDRPAFDTLFARYAPRVLAFALRLTNGRRADAEDLTQETFVAAYRGAERFRGAARPLTWLLSIAVRRHRDSNRRGQIASVPLQEYDGSPGVENAAIASVALRDALETLDDSFKTAFLLVAVQGLTHAEAAAVLKAPVGTVKWRVAEATKRLRRALADDLPVLVETERETRTTQEKSHAPALHQL